VFNQQKENIDGSHQEDQCAEYIKQSFDVLPFQLFHIFIQLTQQMEHYYLKKRKVNDVYEDL